jgi:MFS transporter, DHA2 family, multidrug resistance protein
VLGPALGGYITDNWNCDGFSSLISRPGSSPYFWFRFWSRTRPGCGRRKPAASTISACPYYHWPWLSADHDDRGEDDDWFGSNFIQLMALLAFLGIFGAIGWLLIAKKPIVNLMVFKDWDFSIGCLLIAAAAGILYASAVAIPQLTQQVLLYTPTWAGLVLSPDGIAIMMLIPVVNALVEIGAGVRARVHQHHHHAGRSLPHPDDDADASKRRARLPARSNQYRRISDPISRTQQRRHIAVCHVPQRRRLHRHFLATAAITERTQIHQAYLWRWTTPLHQPFETLIATYEQALRAMGRAGSAVRDDAVGRIYQVFQLQAAVLTYANIFMYAAVIALIMIPFSFLVAPIKCAPRPSPHDAGVRH